MAMWLRVTISNVAQIYFVASWAAKSTRQCDEEVLEFTQEWMPQVASNDASAFSVVEVVSADLDCTGLSRHVVALVPL
jgi:hypothetical protein